MDLFRNSSLEQIQSVLSGYQQFSSHESATEVQSRRSTKTVISSSQQKHLEATGIPPEVLWCISLYEVTTNNGLQRMAKQTSTIQHSQQRPVSAKPNDNQQRMVRHTNTTQHCPVSVGLIYTLSKHHTISQASALAKHQIPLFQAASKKTPCCLFSVK